MSHLFIGHLYTALHAACASAVARVVEANGVDVTYVDLNADDRDEALTAHEVDILVSAWLPDDEMLLSSGREAIGSLYTPELSFCALDGQDVPETWDAMLFDSLIVTDDPLGHTRQKAEEARVKRSDLAALPLEIIDEAGLIDRLQHAGAQGQAPLVVTWQPHAVFHAGLIRPLVDRAGLLGMPRVARLVLREGVREKVDEDLLDELSGMMLGNRVMSALDHAISVEGIDPESAAESWQRGRLLGR